jgi:Uma2 family endonuclease
MVPSMSPAGPGRKLRYEDLAALPDDGCRHELIDGEHFATAAPVPLHQRVLTRLAHSLSAHVAATGGGEVLIGPVDVVLSPHDVLEPDLIFVSDARSHLVTDKCVVGPPDIVVEILSLSTRRRDRTVKRRLYMEAGVLEYWIVDSGRGTVSVHRAAAPASPTTLSTPPGREESLELLAAQGGALESPLLPGWQLRLADLLRLS